MRPVPFDPCLTTLKWLSERLYRIVPAGHPRRDHCIALITCGEAEWDFKVTSAVRITHAGRKRMGGET